MKHSAKNYIKKKAMIVLVVIIMTILISILYLGFYEKEVEPVEKTSTIEVILTQ